MSSDYGSGSGSDPVGANWLLSMADLVSLLLAFFIMMFSMSSLETEKWKALMRIASASEPATVTRSAPLTGAAETPLPRQESVLGADLGYLGAVLGEKLAGDEALRDAVVARSPDGLVIAVPGQLLFAPGSAEPAAAAHAALARLGGMLAHLDNRIEVRGYADPTPIHTADFSSNWELSLARAQAVASALAQAGYRRGITAYGQADSRFGAIASGRPEPERLRLARRVDIVVRPSRAETSTGTTEPRP